MTPKPAGFKKRKKGVKKVGLSFGDDEEGGGEKDEGGASGPSSKTAKDKTGSVTPATPDLEDEDQTPAITKKRLKPNAAVSFTPKALTKTALARDAALKDSLRKQYLQLQEAVKATEFILPFVFFEGKDMPGGKVRVKKGDFVWLFLERARKVGAELAEGDGSGVGKRRDWARIGVDDLMVVRGTMSVPHVSCGSEPGYHDSLLTIGCTVPGLPLPDPEQKHRLQPRPSIQLLRRAHTSNAN